MAPLVDAVTPWVNLAMEKISEGSEGAFGMSAGIAAQVNTVLEVLKVLRTVTSESYFEDDVLVTHTLIQIRDIEQ